MNIFNSFTISSVAYAMLILCLLVAQSSVAAGQELPTPTPTVQENQQQLGIVDKHPEAQPFVAIDGGKFMVPYTTKIPGTDIEFTMLPIPAGKFMMGSPDDEADRRDDEGPQFEVTVKPFWMGKYEVTWAEYKKYMELEGVFKDLQDKGLRAITADNEIDGVTAPSSLYEPSATYEAGEDPEQPAASMTQFAAKQYTKWLSLTSAKFYRLPTEAEWEYACRAGTTTAYYYGDDPDELENHAWTLDNADDERHPVGEKVPNPWGLHDMYGNVSEWVLDQYSEDGYKRFEGKSVGAAEAFQKPTKLYPRVVRGGSWDQDVEDARSAARLASDDETWRSADPNFPKSPWWFTDSPALGVGFRLLRPLDEGVSRTEKAAVWDADLEEIWDHAKIQIDENGKGSVAPVDPKLPTDIQGLAN